VSIYAKVEKFKFAKMQQVVLKQEVLKYVTCNNIIHGVSLNVDSISYVCTAMYSILGHMFYIKRLNKEEIGEFIK